MSVCLSLKKVSYKDILDNINLNLEAKKFYVLTGPSGSGKTTLAKCMVNLIKYTGTIEKDNKITINYFGDINTFVKEKVIDNIIFSLQNSGLNKTESKKRAYDIAKKMGITDLLFKKEEELTYSEKKIALFTILASKESDVIILDDSFDINDQYRKKIIKYLNKLSKTSTIIFITNNEEDYLIADSIIIINDGKIIKNENTIEIFKDEKLFVKNKLSLPFSYQLSSKLMFYGLINHETNDMDEIIGEIWK